MDLSTEASEAVRRLPVIRDVLTAQGMTFWPLVLEPPAPTGEVAAIEEQIGRRLPDSFRRVITSVSRRVDFDWHTPDLPVEVEGSPPFSLQFREPFRDVSGGAISWSLTELPALVASHQSWIDVCFPDPNDPYDAVWHNKFPFMDVGNGDMLAIDLGDKAAGRVVYLEHHLDGGNDYTLAPSFEELLVRWIPLACPGAEDVGWWPFHSAAAGGIDPTSEVARDWVQLMNLGHDPWSTI